MSPDPQEFAYLILFVQEDGQGRKVLFQEFLDRFPAFFRIHTEKDQPFGLVLGAHPFQRRSLLPAIGSPCGPEVEEDHFPQMILDLDRFPLKVLEGKIRKRRGLGKGLKNHPPPALSPDRVPHLASQDKPSQTRNSPSHPTFDFHVSPTSYGDAGTLVL